MAIIQHIPTDRLGHAVARQMERDSERAVAEVRHERLREILRAQVRCDHCGEAFHYRHMSRVLDGGVERWLCKACFWPAAGN